jgi:hypothetical protein
MNELLLALIAFALGYLCGLLTKHELWVWVKKHGIKTKKNK